MDVDPVESDIEAQSKECHSEKRSVRKLREMMRSQNRALPRSPEVRGNKKD
jgi:hypothetical protein